MHGVARDAKLCGNGLIFCCMELATMVTIPQFHDCDDSTWMDMITDNWTCFSWLFDHFNIFCSKVSSFPLHLRVSIRVTISKEQFAIVATMMGMNWLSKKPKIVSTHHGAFACRADSTIAEHKSWSQGGVHCVMEQQRWVPCWFHNCGPTEVRTMPIPWLWSNRGGHHSNRGVHHADSVTRVRVWKSRVIRRVKDVTR